MSSGEYLSNAAACLLAAKTSNAPSERVRWLAMAQAWKRLAEEAERSAQRDALIGPKDDRS